MRPADMSDFRYQELYREYKKRGVQLVFHSYHNGGMTLGMKEQYRDIWGVMVAATMQTSADYLLASTTLRGAKAAVPALSSGPTA